MKTNVQATSIHAYHANAAFLSESRERVAAEIYRLTKAGKPAYISLVTRNLKEKYPNTDKSGVSARMNELANDYPDGFIMDGMRRKMIEMKNKVFDPESGKGGQWVKAYTIVNYTVQKEDGAQLSMF